MRGGVGKVPYLPNLRGLGYFFIYWLMGEGGLPDPSLKIRTRPFLSLAIEQK